MKFKSKVDWWVHLVFGLTTAGLIMTAVMPPIMRGGIGTINYVMLVVSVLSIFLIVSIWLNTYYILSENELRVKCGFWKATRIAYESVKKIRKTNSPMASSALSIGRIEILYGVGGVVMISPENEREFIQELEIKTGKNLEENNGGK